MSAYLSREEATNVCRGIFRRCGYAIAEHGTKGQDLDLIAVPWTDRAGVPALIVDEVVEALEGTVLRGAEPGEKPHGRLVWTIVPGGRRPHDLWYLDLGVMCPDRYRVADAGLAPASADTGSPESETVLSTPDQSDSRGQG